MNDTEFLSDIGFLGPDVIAVHCVHCNTGDIEICATTGPRCPHNPCSNMYLASGCAPIPEMLAAGVTVGLASDGPASSNNHSLFQAMKFAALQQKGVHQDATIITAEEGPGDGYDRWRARRWPRSRDWFDRGRQEGGHCCGGLQQCLHDAIHHPVSAMVYSALGHEVTTVMIDGRIVMRDGIVATVDETR